MSYRKNLNRASEWDRLLSNNHYLLDSGTIVQTRISTMSSWFIGDPKLNIGSGQGFFEDFNSGLINDMNWVSLDISVQGLRRIKKRYDVANLMLGNALSLPFADKSFGTVIISEVIEHIGKSINGQVYKELLRVLKPKGRIVLSVPVYEPRSLVDHPVGHVRKYTPEIIGRELKNNGLEIVEEKQLWAFEKLVGIKTLVCRIMKLRRPSVIVFLCKKS